MYNCRIAFCNAVRNMPLFVIANGIFQKAHFVLCNCHSRFAPESIKEQKFTAESDVWSYGVTIWEMFELWDSDKESVTPYENLKPTEVCCS